MSLVKQIFAPNSYNAGDKTSWTHSASSSGGISGFKGLNTKPVVMCRSPSRKFFDTEVPKLNEKKIKWDLNKKVAGYWNLASRAQSFTPVKEDLL